MLRKVVRITAWDSPNVKLAMAQLARGEVPTNEIVVPGIITWDRLQTYLRLWDAEMQQIKLRAEFPEGAAELLFPLESLELSWQRWREHDSGRQKRQMQAIGIDPGEGSANTSWAGVDKLGLLKLPNGRPSLISKKTPDTSQIPWLTMELGRMWQVPPDRWMMDRGGGGKQHADRLRGMGFKVQTVMFNDKAQMPLKRGLVLLEQKREVREDKSAYGNLRAEMYWDLAEAMKPRRSEKGILLPDCGFALPPEGYDPATDRLLAQLRPIPKVYDDEGRAMMPPKPDMIKELYNGEGSPDEADALVLAVHGLTHKSLTARAGVA